MSDSTQGTTVPSPLPPWHRPVLSPTVQTLFDTGTITLGCKLTFLNHELENPANPVSVTLPDGNWIDQEKSLMIPTDLISGTETFNVYGTFAGGFTQLIFNTIGFSADLRWDGKGWQLIGGNARLNVP